MGVLVRFLYEQQIQGKIHPDSPNWQMPFGIQAFQEPLRLGEDIDDGENEICL